MSTTVGLGFDTGDYLFNHLTLSLGRCDKTPQELGESIGNRFFQNITVVDTKAIADALKFPAGALLPH